jgi:hypothetical protein
MTGTSNPMRSTLLTALLVTVIARGCDVKKHAVPHVADRVESFCTSLFGRVRNYAGQYRDLNALTDAKAKADAETHLLLRPNHEARSAAVSELSNEAVLCLESRVFDRTELGKREDRVFKAEVNLVFGGEDTTSIQTALDAFVVVVTEIDALPIDEE